MKKKIIFGYGLLFVLMGLVVAWAVTNLVSLGKASDAILRENYRSILAVENKVDALERQDSGILLLFLGRLEFVVVIVSLVKLGRDGRLMAAQTRKGK